MRTRVWKKVPYTQDKQGVGPEGSAWSLINILNASDQFLVEDGPGWALA